MKEIPASNYTNIYKYKQGDQIVVKRAVAPTDFPAPKQTERKP